MGPEPLVLGEKTGNYDLLEMKQRPCIGWIHGRCCLQAATVQNDASLSISQNLMFLYQK